MMKYDSTEPLKLETGAEGVAGVTGRSGGAVRGAGPPGVFPPDGSRRQVIIPQWSGLASWNRLRPRPVR